MTETRRGRIENVILQNLAGVYHGHENIPYKEQLAAARLSKMIDGEGDPDEEQSPWGLRERGGVIELGGGMWTDIDFILSKKTCKEIENHPDITLGTEADR